MSFTDPPADPVQPEGQGEEGTQGAPYAEYLNRIPEQLRGDVEPVFKDWDANTTRRFQEHSEYRKGWEPYEQTGVNKYDPEAVAWALQFYEAQQNNPQAVVEWAQNYATERGLTFAEQAAAQQQDPPTEDFGLYGEPNQQQLEQLLEQRMGPIQKQMEQFQSWQQQQAEQSQQQQATAYLEGEMKKIEQAHPDLFNDPKSAEFHREKAAVYAGKYIESDPNNAIQRGWDDWQKTIAHIEKQALQSKVDAPKPAEGGGIPDVNPPKALRLDDPAVAAEAMQFLRNNQAA